MRRGFISYAAITVLAVLLALGPLRAHSESPSSQQESTIQQQNREILDELRAIRQLLERMAPAQPQPKTPQPVSISNLEGFTLGRKDAPVTMIEFSDLQCPFCREYALNTFDLIKKNWIDTGKLRYIARDLPLEIHGEALYAARAARCSGDQGRFWEMRTTLMQNAQRLSQPYVTRTAVELKLDPRLFARCMERKTFNAEIQSDLAEAERLGISGTPAFVLGKVANNVLDGVLMLGAQPYTAFDSRLEQLLQSQSKLPASTR
jgi:protein-disulfide isomerase